MYRSLLLSIALLTACKGPAGEPGPQGDPGLPGDAGADGDKGATGDNGVDGADGQTLIELGADETWSTDQVIDGIIYVPDGITLTIEGGATVAFTPGAGLFVDGDLVLNGTATAKVGFEAHTTLSGSTFGVHVGGTGDQSKLHDATFTGIDLTVENGATAAITDIDFADATLAIYERTAAITVDGCTFADNFRANQTEIIARDVLDLTVKDSDFSEFSNAIVFDGLNDGARLAVTGASFTNGARALAVGTVGTTDNIATIDASTVSDLTGQGFVFNRTVATVTNSTFTGTFLPALNADRYSTLTVVDSDITDVVGYSQPCITAGSILELDGVDIKNCGGSGVETRDEATFTDVTITTTGADGISQAGFNLVATNLAISDIADDGINSDGDLTLTGIDIADVGGDCMQIDGDNVTANDMNLTNCGADGIRTEGNASFNKLNIDGAGDDCFDSNGDTVTVTEATFDQCKSNGFEVSGNPTTLNLITLTNVGSHGVNATAGVLTIDKATITAPNGDGIVHNGSDDLDRLVVKNATITGPADDGVDSNVGTKIYDIIVSNPADDGIVTTAHPLLISGAGISGTGGRGIASTYTDCLVEDVTVDNSTDTGVALNGGQIQFSEIKNGKADGLATSTDQFYAITNNKITNNAGVGVRGRASNPNETRVIRNNIIGNVGFGIVNVQMADGNYVNTNRGQAGTDTVNIGAMDGVRDGDTTQISDADSTTNAQSVIRTDVGPRP